MDDAPVSGIGRFFRIVTRGRSYLNVAYLLLAFPLGTLYFVALVTGVSLGLGLIVIVVGVPILVGTLLLVRLFVGWERAIATGMLGVRFPDPQPREAPAGLLDRLRALLTDTATWKGLAYLFIKFPLGIASFTVVATLFAVALAFLTAPLTYNLLSIQIVGLWVVDSMSEAVGLSLLGLVVAVGALHACKWLAWASGRLARALLG